jgi:hypothetical protein
VGYEVWKIHLTDNMSKLVKTRCNKSQRWRRFAIGAKKELKTGIIGHGLRIRASGGPVMGYYRARIANPRQQELNEVKSAPARGR